MAGLPKRFIKKYGVSKKAWSEYRKSKSTNRKKSKSQPTKKASIRRARGAYVARKRKGKRKSYSRSSGMSVAKIAGISFIYGFARQPVSELISNLPIVGQLGDEASMAVVDAVVASKARGVFKDIGKLGLASEMSNLGRATSAGGLSLAGLNLGGMSQGSGGTVYL